MCLPSEVVDGFRRDLAAIRSRRRPIVGVGSYPHLMVDDGPAGRELLDLGGRWRLELHPGAVYMETKTHSRHPEITFAKGVDENGDVVVMYVDYDKSLGEEAVRRYAENAGKKILAGECPHCREG